MGGAVDGIEPDVDQVAWAEARVVEERGQVGDLVVVESELLEVGEAGERGKVDDFVGVEFEHGQGREGGEGSEVGELVAGQVRERMLRDEFRFRWVMQYGVTYLQETLALGRRLAKASQDRVEREPGKAYVLLPANVSVTRAARMTAGGLIVDPSERHATDLPPGVDFGPVRRADLPLCMGIGAVIAERPALLLFEDPDARSSDPGWDTYRAVARLVLTDDEVLTAVSSIETSPAKRMWLALREVAPPKPGFLFVFATLGDLAVAEAQLLDESVGFGRWARSYMPALVMVLAEAYDGESWAAWVADSFHDSWESILARTGRTEAGD